MANEKKCSIYDKTLGQRVKGTYTSHGNYNQYKTASEIEFTGVLRGGWILLDAGKMIRADWPHVKHTKICPAK